MVNIKVFSQLLSLIGREIFKKLVSKYNSDKHHKGLNSWTHLVSMLFCHLSCSDSVRDISNGLRSTTGNMNHMGISRAPSKSSISYLNEHGDQNVVVMDRGYVDYGVDEYFAHQRKFLRHTEQSKHEIQRAKELSEWFDA